MAQMTPEPEGFLPSADLHTLKPTVTVSDVRSMRLAARAAREGWHVPDAARTAAIHETLVILQNADDARIKLMAAETLLKFDRCDQADQHHRDRVRLAEKAQEQAAGMADVHQLMAEYLDPDDPGSCPDSGMVPSPAEPVSCPQRDGSQ
mgnify:FL=1